MIKFFHELFNPHCEHCAQERKIKRDEERELRNESQHCSSCDTLANENARLVRDNERLLDSLLTRPAEATQKVTSIQDLKPIQTTKTPFIPTAVRRQMLEREDRHTAQLAKDAPKPDPIDKDVELKALEAELDDVRKAREEKTAVNQ